MQQGQRDITRFSRTLEAEASYQKLSNSAESDLFWYRQVSS